MTDFVSASPSRMRDLAREIKECTDAISTNEPGIKSGIEGWDATIDTSPLRNLAGWLKDQAAPMLDRADWAETAANQAQVRPTNSPHPDWQTVPWTITPEMKAQEGQKDALDLAKAAQSDDPKVRQQAARETAWAMEAHADDPEWLQAFFANGGAGVVSAFPRQMLERDGLPLSKESEEQLKWYGIGIANATKLQEQGKITLPANAWDPITKPKDMWSSGMLLSQGPKGDQFGSQFLTTLADSALEWRKNNDPARPPYSAGQVVGTGYVPGGYVQDDGDWWTSLGIDVSYIDTNAEDAAKGVAQIRANDPLSFILNRTGENPDASRGLLTGPKGAEHAKQLVDVHWQTPGPVPQDDSGPASLVIRSATEDRKNHGQQSAEAALNVINAGNDMYHQDRNDYDKEQYKQLPPALAKGLSFVATAYSDDLGISSGVADDSNAVVKSPDGSYHISTNSTELNGFLHAFMTDPEAAGAFEGGLRAQLTAAAQWQSTHPNSPNLLEQQGRLLGMVNSTANDMKWDAADAKDKENAKNKVYFDSLTGIVGGIPGLPDGQAMLLVTASSIAAAHGDVLFPDDAADNASDESQAVTYQNLQGMRLEIAQGLVQGGKIPAPEGLSFYHDGVIKIENDQDKAAFQHWWGTVSQDGSKFESYAQEGFNEANNQSTPNDEKHGG